MIGHHHPQRIDLALQCQQALGSGERIQVVQIADHDPHLSVFTDRGRGIERLSKTLIERRAALLQNKAYAHNRPRIGHPPLKYPAGVKTELGRRLGDPLCGVTAHLGAQAQHPIHRRDAHTGPVGYILHGGSAANQGGIL